MSTPKRLTEKPIREFSSRRPAQRRRRNQTKERGHDEGTWHAPRAQGLQVQSQQCLRQKASNLHPRRSDSFRSRGQHPRVRQKSLSKSIFTASIRGIKVSAVAAHSEAASTQLSNEECLGCQRNASYRTLPTMPRKVPRTLCSFRSRRQHQNV